MSTPAIIPANVPYVLPSSTNGELNDRVLRQFLQTLVVGVTGMKPTLVFPRWQENPPDQPPYGTDWAAIGEIDRTHDTFAAVVHETDPADELDPNIALGADVIYRNQILQVLASFYGPSCQSNGELFAMGLSLAQNREAMAANWFALVECGDARNVPAIIKGRWVPGSDVEFRIRRKQIYAYDIPNLVQAEGTITTDSGLVENFIANASTE